MNYFLVSKMQMIKTRKTFKNLQCWTFILGVSHLSQCSALQCGPVPCSEPAKAPHPICYPVFLHGQPLFPYPDFGSFHHDTLSISFFPGSPIHLPSIYQSISPPLYLLDLSLIYIFCSLCFSPRYDKEMCMCMCALMSHMHKCVEVRGQTLVLFLRYCLPCFVDKRYFPRLELQNFSRKSISIIGHQSSKKNCEQGHSCTHYLQH